MQAKSAAKKAARPSPSSASASRASSAKSSQSKSSPLKAVSKVSATKSAPAKASKAAALKSAMLKASAAKSREKAGSKSPQPVKTALKGINSAVLGASATEIPAPVRSLAQATVNQAKQAFTQLMTQTEQAIANLGGSAKSVQDNSKDIAEKAMSNAAENMVAAFAFAERVTQAKDVRELFTLQSDFIRNQFVRLGEQAKDIGQSMQRIAGNAPQQKAK